MVFRDPLSSLDSAHSVEAILARPLRLRFGLSPAERAAETRALLSELDPALLPRRPRQLSGGQRVALARALAARPDLPLCDEITSALDVTIHARVPALLERLRAGRGPAMLLISHDLAVAAEPSHRIAVLERGTLRDHGPAASVLEAPTHPHTRRLLGALDAAARPAPEAAEWADPPSATFGARARARACDEEPTAPVGPSVRGGTTPPRIVAGRARLVARAGRRPSPDKADGRRRGHGPEEVGGPRRDLPAGLEPSRASSTSRRWRTARACRDGSGLSPRPRCGSSPPPPRWSPPSARSGPP